MSLNQVIILCLLFAAVVFIGVIIGFAVVFVKISNRKRINDSLPVETARATVKSNAPLTISFARSDLASGTFYITFETEKGDMKFGFDGRQYAAHNFKMLKNGDAGILSYQGTRYIKFVKE